MILNAQLKHAGKYTCTAQTVVDSASESATLVVRGNFSCSVCLLYLGMA